MEFRFTEEQQMIRDTAEAFLAEVSTSAAVREAMATERGYSEALWQQISEEMMWPALHIPEAYGGLGLGFVELAAMQEQMGRTLLCAPFLSTVGFAVNALLVAGSDAQKSHYLGEIAAGKTATLAFMAPLCAGWAHCRYSGVGSSRTRYLRRAGHQPVCAACQHRRGQPAMAAHDGSNSPTGPD